MQRQLETAVRAEKDRAVMAKAAGNDEIRQEAQKKINQLTSKYADFSKASGLPTKVERMQVKGFRSVKIANVVDGGSKKLHMAQENLIQWIPKGENISFKEYKKLREYATSKGITLRGFKKSDVDIALAKETIDEAARMLEKYPELKGTAKKPFTLELSTAMRANDFAETSHGVKHIIKLNADAFRDKEKLASEYKKLADAGWFVKGTDYHSIIHHEIGHIIGEMRDIDGLHIAELVLETDEVDKVFAYIKKNLSKYSSVKEDGTEIISEVMSAYEFGIKDDFILTFLKICGIL